MIKFGRIQIFGKFKLSHAIRLSERLHWWQIMTQWESSFPKTINKPLLQIRTLKKERKLSRSQNNLSLKHWIYSGKNTPI